MLNHNFVYGEAFHNEEDFVNDAALALLDHVNDGFLDEAYLKDYIFNMYGKKFDDFSEYNSLAPKADGYFYIIPRGYDLYEHKIASVIDNEDGSYTVITEVVIDYHFGEKVNAFSTTFFIENEDSGVAERYACSLIANNKADAVICGWCEYLKGNWNVNIKLLKNN